MSFMRTGSSPDEDRPVLLATDASCSYFDGFDVCTSFFAPAKRVRLTPTEFPAPMHPVESEGVQNLVFESRNV